MSPNESSNIMAINSSINNNTNELSSYNGDGNFFSIDDMNKPLIQGEIEEDKSSFEDRLKNLQSERDFNFDRINNQKLSPPDKIQTQSQDNERQQMIMMEQQKQMMMEQQKQMMMEQQKQNINQPNNDNILMEKLLNRLNKYEENENSVSSNSELLSKLELLTNENINMKKEFDQISNLKTRIADEFTELNKKNEMIQTNLQILNQRELELNTKESEIKQLIHSYRPILNSRFYQMNVSSDENKSAYSYFFNKIDNIIGIKIISYSVPQARYNITSNNNKLSINESIIEIPNGKYSIENLIEVLNKNVKDLSGIDLNFKLNVNQRINIESNQDFTIKDTLLKNINLGILNTDNVIEEDEKFIIKGSNTWDLRLEDKLFLYFKNINDDPISIIYMNGNSESQIEFEDPIELNKLDIELRDSYGNLYDFNNLSHSINLQLELTNQFSEIKYNSEKQESI